jgi:hypothetical protein
MDKLEKLPLKTIFDWGWKMLLILLCFALIPFAIVGKEYWKLLLIYIISITVILTLISCLTALLFPNYFYKNYLQEKTPEEIKYAGKFAMSKGIYFIIAGLCLFIFGKFFGIVSSNKGESLIVFIIGFALIVTGTYYLKKMKKK